MEVLLGLNFDRRETLPPKWDLAHFGRFVGGPQQFIALLEMQLGLTEPYSIQLVREQTMLCVMRNQLALGAPSVDYFRTSFKVDPRGVARQTLAWRDELLMAHRRELSLESCQGGSERLAAIVHLSKSFDNAKPPLGLANRLAAVVDCLQTLPIKLSITSMTLVDAKKDWPERWQGLFEALEKLAIPCIADQLADGEKNHNFVNAETDVEFVMAANIREAADYTAHQAQRLRETGTVAIIQGDQGAALDTAFLRAAGHAVGSRADAFGCGALQLLPALVGLAFEPQSPHAWMRYLRIDPSPLPAGLRYRLRKALATKPAVRSSVWNETYNQWASSVEPQKVASVSIWLDPFEAVNNGWNADAIGFEILDSFLHRLEKWALKIGVLVDEQDFAGLYNLADSCVCLRRLIVIEQALGPKGTVEIDRERLENIIFDDILMEFGSHEEFHEAKTWPGSGNPILAVPHPGALSTPFDHIIWFCANDCTAPQVTWDIWSQAEREALEKHGFHPQSSRARLASESLATRRAVGQAKSTLTLVACAKLGNEVDGPHPIAYEIAHERASRYGSDPIPRWKSCEDLISKFSLKQQMKQFGPPFHEPWNLQDCDLEPQAKLSPSSAEKLVGCPLAYVMKRKAKIDCTPDAGMPDERVSLGNMTHAALQQVLAQVSSLTSDLALKQAVDSAFDVSVAEEAGYLSQHLGRDHDRASLRRDLLRCTKSFLRFMEANDLVFEGTEINLEDTTVIGLFAGRCDVILAQRETPTEKVVVDIKWSSSKYFKKLLEVGWSTQLAAYASLAGSVAKPAPSLYFQGPEGVFYGLKNADGSTLNEIVVVEGPPLSTVWKHLCEEVQKNKDDLARGVAALGFSAETPKELAPSGRHFTVSCKYCSYSHFCKVKNRPVTAL